MVGQAAEVWTVEVSVPPVARVYGHFGRCLLGLSIIMLDEQLESDVARELFLGRRLAFHGRGRVVRIPFFACVVRRGTAPYYVTVSFGLQYAAELTSCGGSESGIHDSTQLLPVPTGQVCAQRCRSEEVSLIVVRL